MLRNCWNCIVFRTADPRLLHVPYVPRKIRSRLNVMLIVSSTAVGSVLFMAAISVFSQVPPIDAAVKLADAVENKSVTWLVAMSAIVAMGVNAYMVKVIIGLVRDSIGAAADVRRELSIIKSIVRKNQSDDDTPER